MFVLDYNTKITLFPHTSMPVAQAGQPEGSGSLAPDQPFLRMFGFLPAFLLLVGFGKGDVLSRGKDFLDHPNHRVPLHLMRTTVSPSVFEPISVHILVLVPGVFPFVALILPQASEDADEFFR